MISPEVFVEQHKNKPYSELVKIRNKILREIYDFENHSYDLEQTLVQPSPEVMYRYNLKYLGKICEVISEKYGKEIMNEEQENISFLKVIREYLVENKLGYTTALTQEIVQRRDGKSYTIEDHIKALVYSMLTNQTKWYRVEPHLPEIDLLFFQYNPDKLLAADPVDLCNGLYRIKCGNMSTKAQMEALGENIRVLLLIEKEYGSIDSFITSKPTETIVKLLSDRSSPYKLRMLGEALVWEYLRNVGIDGAKPDTHLRRFLGADRMGTGEHSPASVSEVNAQVAILSEQSGMAKVEIDNLIWSFCADGFGEVCTIEPHCYKCPVRKWCHHNS